MITQKEKEILVRDKNQEQQNTKSISRFTILLQNLKPRLSSSVILVALFISSILLSLPPFTGVMMIIAMMMIFEWYQMTSNVIRRGYLFLGPVIIFPSIISLIMIHDNTHKWIIMAYFAMIWAVDTFAMIGGKIIGGPKLAKSLSPNKTWSGFFCGVFAGSIVFWAICYFFVEPYIDLDLFFKKYIVAFAIGLSVVAQVSDLFISYFKRQFNIKDTGTIIPGHGGVLDRFDSIILTAPILYLAIRVY